MVSTPTISFNLLRNPFGLRSGKVNLVQYRHNLMVRVDGKPGVRESLRFHPLTGVYNQQGTLHRPHGAGDFVAEVDVSRRIDEVEYVVAAVLGAIGEANGLRLDGDSAFPFQFHGIQHLLSHFSRAQVSGTLNQPVGECRFSMVDMGNDREVPNARRVRGAHLSI